MDIDTSALFAPIVINGHTVKNRLSVAPMTRVSATRDGRATATTSVSRGVASGRSCGLALVGTVPRNAAFAPRSGANRMNVQM